MKIFYAYHDGSKWLLTTNKPTIAYTVIHAENEHDAQMQVFEMILG